MSSGNRRLARVLGAALVLVLAGAFGLKQLGPRTARVPSTLAGVALGSTPHDPGGGTDRRRVLDQAATCAVTVGSDARVARIACDVDAHDARDRVLGTLRELYGKESWAQGGTHRWQNGEARLVLVSAPGSLRVSLESLSASSR